MSLITSAVRTDLQPIQIQPFSNELERIVNPPRDEQSPFSAFFSAALNMLNDTNRMATEAEQAQLDFATGRLDDILAVQMAMDRMSNALNFTTQITNRIIESYREIMRMQL